MRVRQPGQHGRVREIDHFNARRRAATRRHGNNLAVLRPQSSRSKSADRSCHQSIFPRARRYVSSPSSAPAHAAKRNTEQTTTNIARRRAIDSSSANDQFAEIRVGTIGEIAAQITRSARRRPTDRSRATRRPDSGIIPAPRGGLTKMPADKSIDFPRAHAVVARCWQSRGCACEWSLTREQFQARARAQRRSPISTASLPRRPHRRRISRSASSQRTRSRLRLQRR